MNSTVTVIASIPCLKLVNKSKNDSTKPNAELITACQNGDKKAFHRLLILHEPTIAFMVGRHTTDWCDTDDLKQEIHIRIWKSIKQLRNPHAFKSWLNRIVTNLFYEELRRRPRNIQIVSMDEPYETEDGAQMTRDIPDKSQQPEKQLLDKEMSGVLADAMSIIPNQFRKAIVLREMEGLSYEAIAQITNTTLGTVKSRVSRARRKIRKHVSQYLRDCA